MLKDGKKVGAAGIQTTQCVRRSILVRLQHLGGDVFCSEAADCLLIIIMLVFRWWCLVFVAQKLLCVSVYNRGPGQ